MLYQEREPSPSTSSMETKSTWMYSAVLHIECQIRDGKSEPIPLHGAVPEGGGDAPFHPLGKVLPMNGMGYTLFTNVKVALNNVPIDSGSVLYSFRGDFETRLFNTKDVKEGSAVLMGFDEEIVAFESVPDVAANFLWEEVADDTTEPDSLANAALNRWYKRSCQSKRVYFLSHPFSLKYLTKTSGSPQKQNCSYL